MTEQVLDCNIQKIDEYLLLLKGKIKHLKSAILVLPSNLPPKFKIFIKCLKFFFVSVNMMRTVVLKYFKVFKSNIQI